MSLRTKILGIGVALVAVLAVGAGGGAIASSMITSPDIKDGAVHSPDIKDGAVRSPDIRNGGVYGSDLSAGLKERIDASGGEQGEPGLSAYEVAVENGFEGTEEDWLASLVGADGAEGADGADGADGAQGEPGEAGAPGCPEGAELTGPYQVRTSAQGTQEIDAFLCTPIAEEPPAE